MTNARLVQQLLKITADKLEKGEREVSNISNKGDDDNEKIVEEEKLNDESNNNIDNTAKSLTISSSGRSFSRGHEQAEEKHMSNRLARARRILSEIETSSTTTATIDD